jgi:SAM-dependent methyltransferase
MIRYHPRHVAAIPSQRGHAHAGRRAGRLAPYLAARGVSPHGIDLSPGMVKVARRDYPGFDFDVADLRDLPFEDASLAGAVCWYSLIFLAPADRPIALSELARVAKPGGYLVAGARAGNGELRRGWRAAVGLGVEYDGYWMSAQEMQDRVTDAGSATVFQGSVRRGSGLRHRVHLHIRAWHRRRRPRPGDPARRTTHRGILPAASWSHRQEAGHQPERTPARHQPGLSVTGCRAPGFVAVRLC